MTNCRKRLRTLLCLLMTAMLLFTACGKTNNSPDSKQDTDEHPTITMMTYGQYTRLEPFINLLHEKYPEINLEFVSYTGANGTSYGDLCLKNNDMTDIVFVGQILSPEAAKENLLDLSQYDFVNNYPTSILDNVEIDGGLYLLPNNLAISGIYYNKTLFEENGWEVPENFDELSALTEKIHAKGMGACIAGVNLTGWPFSYLFNLAKTDWFVTPQGNEWEKAFLKGEATAKGQWEDTFAYMQQWKDIGMFDLRTDNPDNNTLFEEEFVSRNYAMCYCIGSFRFTENEDGTGDQYGIMPYISKNGDNNIYMTNPDRYIGLNKALAEKGNEQKLEDAVKIMELIATPEGQEALMAGREHIVPILNDVEVSEDSPIYDAYQAMQEGRTIPMTYANWEDILASVGGEVIEFLADRKTADEVIAAMDDLKRTSLEQGSVTLATIEEDFTQEESAKLVAAAYAAEAEADVGLASMGAFHDGLENKQGVCGHLFAGPVIAINYNTVLPNTHNEYTLLTLTGKQINELVEKGFDLYGDGNTFDYVFIVREGLTLNDDKTYTVAVVANAITEDVAQLGNAQVVKTNDMDVLINYYNSMDKVTPSAVVLK